MTTPVLIVAAVPAEVRSLVDGPTVQHAIRTDMRGTDVWPIIEVSKNLRVVISGLGRANAAGATAFTLAQNEYRLVLNVGVAGSLPDSGLALGEVVIATESVFYEEGIALPDGPGDMKALGFALASGGWMDGNRVRIDTKVVNSLASSLGDDATRGTIATVARCSGTDEAANAVRKETGALAEAMEGAAVILAARRMGVPAAEVRVISNTCGERESQQWDFKGALERLDDVLARIVEA